MSPIAEFTLSNPILQETREAFPEVLIQIEDEYISSESAPEIVIFATGSSADLKAFEERLSTDTSIVDYKVLSNFANSKLVQITLSQEGFRGMTYPTAVTLDITFLEITARDTEMRYRAQIPTREALSAYREHCSERDLSFRLITIYQKHSLDTKEYGLTPRQREVLLHSLQEGYFAVPRQTSLEDLAAEFEISAQALSALLRRGQRNLLQSTLNPDTPT